MRIDNAVHRSQRWVMDEIAPDFRLLDVWELPMRDAATPSTAPSR